MIGIMIKYKKIAHFKSPLVHRRKFFHKTVRGRFREGDVCWFLKEEIVLIRITIAMMEQHNKKQVLHHSPLLKRVRQGIWIEQELESRNKCRDHRGVLLTDLPSMTCFACFLYRTQDYYPRGSLTHNGLGLLHQSLLKKMSTGLPTTLWIIWRLSVQTPSALKLTSSWHKTSQHQNHPPDSWKKSLQSLLLQGYLF